MTPSGLAASICIWFGTLCFADPIQMGEISIQGKRFTEGSRNALITYNGLGRPLRHELNLNVNTVLFDYFYWNNTVHSQTDDVQFRLVGWNFALGFSLTQFLDLEYEHFSKHQLDHQDSRAFPVQDSFGFKLYINRWTKPQNKSMIQIWDK